MNHLTLALSMAVVLAIPGSGFADQRDQDQKKDRFRATQGADRPGNPRADRGNRGQAGQLDPAMLVSRLMKQFDADGDEKLDIKELTALMTNLRDRRQSGGMTGGVKAGMAGQRGRDAQTEKQGNRSKQRNNRPTPAAGDPGGDRPIRPSAE